MPDTESTTLGIARRQLAFWSFYQMCASAALTLLAAIFIPGAAEAIGEISGTLMAFLGAWTTIISIYIGGGAHVKANVAKANGKI